MNHLIQSIDISGTRYCVKHGATTPKWRTVSILGGNLELETAEDDDSWIMAGDGVNSGGSIKFATCCLWKATVRFFLESDSAVYTGDVSLNGVLVDSFIRTGSAGETVDIEVDLDALGLMGRACGNIWDITALYEDGTAAEMAVVIIDVTYGPP
jgi:hypothetical protein